MIRQIRKQTVVTAILILAAGLLAGSVFASDALGTLPPAAADVTAEAGMAQVEGEISGKEEVVYAKLSADGAAEDAYIVNILNVSKAGKITDHGDYLSVKNLTSGEAISQGENGEMSMLAAEGEFYYQGNVAAPQLPWIFSIDYTLDGKAADAAALSGAGGRLGIHIGTRRNGSVHDGWYENCVLQISVTLDAALCKNIKAPDGTTANAGGDKLVTFTVMPGKDGDMRLEADVMDFSMPGIQFSALPVNMNIDKPDMSETTEDMENLAEAIGDLDGGVGALGESAYEIADGAEAYSGGMTDFSEGLGALAEGSAALEDGAEKIGDGLDEMSAAAGALPSAISAGAAGDISQGLCMALAQQLLTVHPELILKYNSGAGDGKGHYDGSPEDGAVPDGNNEPDSARDLDGDSNEAFMNAAAALSQDLAATMSPALQSALSDVLSQSLTAPPNASNQNKGSIGYNLKELASSYNNDFKKGLSEYLGGVEQASEGAWTLAGGADGIESGMREYAAGVDKLRDGTLEMKNETADMPAEIDAMVDEMMSEYNKSGYVPLSFASPRNGEIAAVQFVITSEKIDRPEAPEEEDSPETKSSMLDRLLDLFR